MQGASSKKRSNGNRSQLSRRTGRREIGIGEIHILVDVNAGKFRHAVFARSVHGQIRRNRIVLFIARHTRDVDATDKAAGGRILFDSQRHKATRINPAPHLRVN